MDYNPNNSHQGNGIASELDACVFSRILPCISPDPLDTCGLGFICRFQFSMFQYNYMLLTNIKIKPNINQLIEKRNYYPVGSCL